MLLKLFGKANQCIGFGAETVRSVIRLCAATDKPSETAADFALVKSRHELTEALSKGWRSIFLIGEGDLETHFAARIGFQAISVPLSFEYLSDGDILGIDHRSLEFRVLFRKRSTHNSFLVTENCNNRCLMCPQPPKRVSDGWIINEIAESLPLVDVSTPCLTFTGGEPLTDFREFLRLLGMCRDLLPNTAIQVLTNGRAFADSGVVDAWAAVKHPDLIAAIPLYSSVDRMHDYIVQSKGAFDETVLGILKLKDRGQRIEIRIVLHALTAPQIFETCRWIARNLPFVDHVALMGLENAGFSLANESLLWIDPVDYGDALADGLSVLSSARLQASVYNLPYCAIPESTRPYAVQSISDWKNGYDERCQPCAKKPECSGMFESGRPRLSRALNPILC